MADESKQPPEDRLHPGSATADLLRLHRENQDKLVAARTAVEMARASSTSSAMAGHLALQLQKLAYVNSEHEKAIQQLGAYFSSRAGEESARAGNIVAMASQVAQHFNSPEVQRSLENMRHIAGLVGTLYQPPSVSIPTPELVERKANKEAEQQREEQEEARHQITVEVVRAGLAEIAEELRKLRYQNSVKPDAKTEESQHNIFCTKPTEPPEKCPSCAAGYSAFNIRRKIAVSKLRSLPATRGDVTEAVETTLQKAADRARRDRETRATSTPIDEIPEPRTKVSNNKEHWFDQGIWNNQ